MLGARDPPAPVFAQLGAIYRTNLLASQLHFEDMQQDVRSRQAETVVWAMAVHLFSETIALAVILLMMRHVAFVVELRQGTARSEQRRRALLAMLRLLLHDTLSPLNALSLSLEEMSDSLGQWRSYSHRVQALAIRYRKSRTSRSEGRNNSSDSIRRKGNLLSSMGSISSRQSEAIHRKPSQAGQAAVSSLQSPKDVVSMMIATAAEPTVESSTQPAGASSGSASTNTSRGRTKRKSKGTPRAGSGSASPQTDHSRSSRGSGNLSKLERAKLRGAPRTSLLKEMQTLRKDVVPAMASSAGGIQRILSDMVSLQDAQNGKLRLAMEPTNLGQAVSESIFRAFRALASTYQVKLEQWADKVADSTSYEEMMVRSFSRQYVAPGLVK